MRVPGGYPLKLSHDILWIKTNALALMISFCILWNYPTIYCGLRLLFTPPPPWSSYSETIPRYTVDCAHGRLLPGSDMWLRAIPYLSPCVAVRLFYHDILWIKTPTMIAMQTPITLRNYPTIYCGLRHWRLLLGSDMWLRATPCLSPCVAVRLVHHDILWIKTQ